MKLKAFLLITGLIIGATISEVRNYYTRQETAKVEHRDRETQVRTETRIVKEPGGTETTIIVRDSTTRTRTDISETSKPVKAKTNISALAGIDVTSRPQPIYGISVTREFIGPITVGAWGMTNGVVGLSVGINF